jgi:serine O-acetyltransferase
MRTIDRPFRRTRVLLSAPRLIPHIVILLMSKDKSVLRADLRRWAQQLYLDPPIRTAHFVGLMTELLTFKPEYRNVFYLRLGLKARLISWLAPQLSSLQITPRDIGPGLFIQHGLATLVSAEKIGANCSIWQNVTIGFSGPGASPTIGDNVTIWAGAKIIGRVHVGDNVVIGANTVVIDNVGSNVTVFGVPARVVFRTGPGRDIVDAHVNRTRREQQELV